MAHLGHRKPVHPDLLTAWITRAEKAEAGLECAADRIDALERALKLGLQLGESGRHGSGASCPTCHFVREARAALRATATHAVHPPAERS